MVMNWGIRPADLIDHDEARRQLGDEPEPVRVMLERPSTVPTAPVDTINRGGGQPLR